jgi:hypothetical protein
MHRRSNAAGLKSVVHFEVLFFGIDDEVIVDSDLAEFIDDDSIAPAVRPVRIRTGSVVFPAPRPESGSKPSAWDCPGPRRLD